MSEWDRQATPGGVPGPQWVSAAEAADVAGVTPGTVRYWARNGLIVSEVVEGAAGEKTLVRLDEVLAHSRGEGAPRRPPPGGGAVGGPAAGEVVTDLPARTSELAPILKSIPEIMAQLTSATDRAARAETKVEFLSAQLAEMRRRLADAEAAAGAPASEPIAIPEEWEKLDDSAAVVAEEAPAPARPAEEEPSGVPGWPAPPPETLHDVPAAEVSDPGPGLVDWGSAAPESSDGIEAAEEPAAPEVSAPVAETSPDLSLGDIWNEPAAPPDRHATEPEPGGVEWHDPAGAAAEAVRTRAANAPIPEGDDFYGPRRRRWFRRRR